MSGRTACICPTTAWPAFSLPTTALRLSKSRRPSTKRSKPFSRKPQADNAVGDDAVILAQRAVRYTVRMQRDYLMKARLAFVLSNLTFCPGAPCSSAHAQRLYPVQGPATAETPPQEFTAKLSNIGGKNGKVTLSLPERQRFLCTW